MPITARTFRLFVSSTFEDLQQERDALQCEVFPELRNLCEQQGARFQAIDLRWRVREEAAHAPARRGVEPRRGVLAQPRLKAWVRRKARCLCSKP